MRKHVFFCIGAVIAAAWVLGQSECPVEMPKPPFDATGAYVGTWQGQSTDEMQDVAACPLQLTLTQDISASYPRDHAVKGTAVIEYSCFDLPDWAPPIPPSTVAVSGLLGDDGKLTLWSGGCGTALCIVLGLNGDAEDADADGHMDGFSGAWSLTFLLAGVEPFGFTGTFQLAREEE